MTQQSYSAKLELSVIKSITRANPQVAAILLTNIAESSFAYPPASKAYKRIRSVLTRTGQLIDWSSLCEDPVLDDNTRGALKNYRIKVNVEEEKIRVKLSQLEEFRKKREIHSIGKQISDLFEAPSFDPDKELPKLLESISKINYAAGTGYEVHNFGPEITDTDPLTEAILAGSTVKRFIPTGIRAFDSKNKGIPEGALFVLGGYTGVGKSLLAQHMAYHAAQHGCKVAFFSLEMRPEEIQSRHLARIAQVPYTKIMTGDLSPEEKDKIKKRRKTNLKAIHDSGGLFSLFDLKSDMSIDEIFLLCKPFEYDLIVIDYITLLKGTDSDDQVKALGRVTRAAKIFANNNNLVVMLLAQVDETGKIKYARKIGEDANNAWLMEADPQNPGLCHIRQAKGRANDRTPFSIKIDYQIMKVESAPEQTKVPSFNQKDQKRQQGQTQSSTRTVAQEKTEFKQAASGKSFTTSDFIPI